MSSEIDVSLIIPCFNESQTIGVNVPHIVDIMSATKYNYEIILIDDCSTDNTRELGRAIAEKYKNVVWKEHQANMGRGGTVAEGIELSKGRIAGYIDMDLEVAASYIISAIVEIENGADLAMGWRLEHLRLNVLPLRRRVLALGYWFLRLILSKGYNLVLRIVLSVHFNDSECGLKFFNRERILPVLRRVKARHWFWDTEIVVRSHMAGLRIKEIPCLFLKKLHKTSTVKVFRDTRDYLYQIYQFRREIRGKKK